MITLVEDALDIAALAGAGGVSFEDLMKSLRQSELCVDDTETREALQAALKNAPKSVVTFENGRVCGSTELRRRALGLSDANQLPLSDVTIQALELIGGAGEEGILQSEVASRLDVAPQTLFHHVKRLRHLQLIISGGGTHETPGKPSLGNSNRLWIARFAPQTSEGLLKCQGWLGTFKERLIERLQQSERKTLSQAELAEYVMPASARPSSWSEEKYAGYKKRRFRRLRDFVVRSGICWEVSGKKVDNKGDEASTIRCLALNVDSEKVLPAVVDKPHTRASGPPMVWELDPTHRVIELMRTRGDDGVTNDDLGSLFGLRFERKGAARLWKDIENLQPFEKVPEHHGKRFFYRYRMSDRTEGRELTRTGGMIITEKVRRREKFLLTKIRDQGQILSYREVGKQMSEYENEGKTSIASRVIQKLVRRLEDRKMIKEMVFYPYRQPVHAVTPYDLCEDSPEVQDFIEKHKLARSTNVTSVVAKKAEMFKKMEKIDVEPETTKIIEATAQRRRLSSLVARQYGIYQGKMQRAKILHYWILRFYLSSNEKLFKQDDILDSMICQDYIRSVGIYREVGQFDGSLLSTPVKNLDTKLYEAITQIPPANNQARSLLGLLEGMGLIFWNNEEDSWELRSEIKGPDPENQPPTTLRSVDDLERFWTGLHRFSEEESLVADTRFFAGKRVPTPHWKRSWDTEDAGGIVGLSNSDMIRLESAMTKYLAQANIALKDLEVINYDDIAKQFDLRIIHVWKYCEYRKHSDSPLGLRKHPPEKHEHEESEDSSSCESPKEQGLAKVQPGRDDTIESSDDALEQSPKRARLSGGQPRPKKSVRFEDQAMEQPVPPAQPPQIATGIDSQSLLEEAIRDGLLRNPKIPGKRSRSQWTADLDKNLVAAVIEHKLGGWATGEGKIWVRLSKMFGRTPQSLRNHHDKILKRPAVGLGLSQLMEDCDRLITDGGELPSDFKDRINSLVLSPTDVVKSTGLVLPDSTKELDSQIELVGFSPPKRRSVEPEPSSILRDCTYFGYKHLLTTPELAVLYLRKLDRGFSVKESIDALEASDVVVAKTFAGPGQFAGRVPLTKALKPMVFSAALHEEVAGWRHRLLSAAEPLVFDEQTKIEGSAVAAAISLMVESELSVQYKLGSTLSLHGSKHTSSPMGQSESVSVQFSEEVNGDVDAAADVDENKLMQLGSAVGDRQAQLASEVLSVIKTTASGKPPSVLEETLLEKVDSCLADIRSTVGLLEALQLVKTFPSGGGIQVGLASEVAACLVEGQTAPRPWVDWKGDVDSRTTEALRGATLSCLMARPGIRRSELCRELITYGYNTFSFEVVLDSLEREGRIEILEDWSGVVLSDSYVFASQTSCWAKIL